MDLTKNWYSSIVNVNSFGIVIYWMLLSITLRTFTKTSNHVELRRIFMMAQCQEDLKKNKEKINIIYENLKKWDMLKEDSVESLKPNDFVQQEKVTNVEKQITEKISKRELKQK